MAKGEASDLDSLRKYGLHPYILLEFNATLPLQFGKSPSDLKPNYDLSVTIDTKNVLNPTKLITTALGYDGVNIAITEPIHNNPGNLPVDIFEYDYESNSEFVIVKYGNSEIRLRPKRLYEHMAEVLFGSISEKEHFKDYLKLLTDFYTHEDLNRNIFVTDNSKFHDIKWPLVKNRSIMIITSEKLISIIECIEKRFGRYYLRPRVNTSKGSYYWIQLHKNLQNFDKTWATAVFGVHEMNLNSKILYCTKSLGDRCMSLLEVADEIKHLYFESPDNEAGWDIANKLNYFVILVTGLLDNLAWLTVYRYSLQKNYPEKKRQGVALNCNRNGTKRQLHEDILSSGQVDLFQLIKNFQKRINLFYPIRDSVQHRLVLQYTRVENLKEEWAKVMLKVDDSVVKAFNELDEIQYQKINPWGLYLVDEKEKFIEPYTFIKKAINEIFLFTDQYLNYLDYPDLVKNSLDTYKKVTSPIDYNKIL